jgi:hypothetical protein
VGFQQRIIRKLPRGIRHFPLDSTFVFMGVPSAVLSLLGVSRSASLANILPVWAHYMWSATLLIGCVSWGIAVLSTELTEDRYVVIRRVPLMILGLSLVSVDAFVFGLCLIVLGGWSGANAAVFLFAVSAGTYLRRVNLSIRLQVDDGS